jgi:hypothetical protein
MDTPPKRKLSFKDIDINDAELIDSITDDERWELLLEIYRDNPDHLQKHGKLGIKIMLGSDAVLPELFWWVGRPEKKKDWFQ